MKTWIRFGALFCFAFSAAAVAGPPQDCSAPPWVAALAVLDPAAKGACVTNAVDQVLGVNLRMAQFPTDTDTVSTEEVASIWKPLIFDSAKAALEKYRTLVASLALHDVTFVLRPYKNPESVLASSGRGPQAECIVTVYTAQVTPEKRSTSLPTTIAHELAHCLQAWNVPQAYGLAKPARDWWVEGSAEYLGNVVFENAAFLASDAADLEAGGALTSQVYGPALFFAWFAQQKKTPAAVIGFWGAMPTSGGIAEQQAALLATVNADGLQSFAQAWVDGTIQMPTGHALPAPLLDPVTLTASETRTLNGVPFGITRGELSFPEPGDFTLAISDTGSPKLKFNDGTGWAAPPTKGSNCAPKVKFAGISTAPGAPKLTIVANKVSEASSTCPPPPTPKACTDFAKRDPCLNATWIFDDDASQAQINAALPNANPKAVVTGDIALALDSKGTASQTFTDLYVAVGSDVDVSSFSEVSATGRVDASWSTSPEGTLRLCPTSDTAVLTTKVQLFLGAFNPISTVTVDGAQLGDVAYTCSGNTLTLKPPKAMIQGGAPLTWVFHKKGGGCAAVPGPLEALAFISLLALRRRRA